MACCAREGAACGSVSADDCCADGEQRQNIEGAPGLLVASPAVTSWVLPVAAPVQRPHTSHSESLADRPHTYLLDSVFRI
jgi:hypothetical protein